MTEASDTIPAYNARADAAAIGVALEKWARIGFLRGFAGVRSSIIPEGQMKLPSAVFHELAIKNLENDLGSEEEKRRRVRYIDEVTAYLTNQQSYYIEEHYKKSVWGHLMDFVSASIFVVLGGLLIYQFGPFHPVTLVLIGLFGVKLLFLWASVRRMISIAQNAFNHDAEKIRLPWMISQK